MYSKTYSIKGNFQCDSGNVINLITCFRCREQYVGLAINFIQRFRIHIFGIKTNKDRCGSANHLIINVAVLIINMPIGKYRLLNRYLIIFSLALMVYYGNEKNIGWPNYLLTCMVWIILMIYIVWKGKAIENNSFWTDS